MMMVSQPMNKENETEEIMADVTSIIEKDVVKEKNTIMIF